MLDGTIILNDRSKTEQASTRIAAEGVRRLTMRTLADQIYPLKAREQTQKRDSILENCRPLLKAADGRFLWLIIEAWLRPAA